MNKNNNNNEEEGTHTDLLILHLQIYTSQLIKYNQYKYNQKK